MMCKSGSECLLVLILVIAWISDPSSNQCEAFPSRSIKPSSDSNVRDVFQLHSYLKGVLKYLDGYNRSQPKPISGQVTLRTPRSEYGELGNAIKLFQLQELDKMYGSRARPRFGKRAEVPQSDGYGLDYNNMFAEEERRYNDEAE